MLTGHGLLVATRDELDLRNREAVDSFSKATRPDCVFLAAARVGVGRAHVATPCAGTAGV